MTAEIVIMNKECVALAADSAATLTSEKIFNSSNKIFRLMKGLPIGIMVFNRAEFMGVPWETVVKLYRLHLENQNKNFSTVNDCVQDFIDFVILEFQNKQDLYFQKESLALLQNICGQIYQVIRYMSELKEGNLSEVEIKHITNKIINDYYKAWNGSKLIDSLNEEDNTAIKNSYQKFIKEAIQTIYKDLPLTDELSEKLEETSFSIFTKGNIECPLFSGVVFAGFGDDELYPSEKTIIVQGVLNNKLLYHATETKNIDYHGAQGSIRSYAQAEMVSRFMDGIDPEYYSEIISMQKEIFYEYPVIILEALEKKLTESNTIQSIPQKIKDELLNNIQQIADTEFNSSIEHLGKFQYFNFNKTILDVVESLPKDEIALMAESLVNLTSFKRRVSMQAQSVGGPIDVAVISKKDGFVWIKRKHYFDQSLNPHFGENMYISRGE